jgi:Predicted esterase
LSAGVCAQSRITVEKESAKVETFQLESRLMSRQMPYRVVLPKDYKKKREKRYAVVYLLHGLAGHFDNWTDKTKLAAYSLDYDFIIVTPEGGDGWYTDSATVPNDRYESYIVEELIPEIDKKFRTFAVREKRVIAGLSMGGYGALKFGLKYPEKFVLAGSFSGALSAASVTDKNSTSWIVKSVMSVFGGEESETRKANDIFGIVREIPAEKIKDLPFFYLDCGTEDASWIQNNRDFAQILAERKIPHEYRQLPGAHNWIYWDEQVQEFLRLSQKITSRAKAKAD